MELPKGADPSDYFIFAVVRNPFEREVSHYRYRRMRRSNNYHRLAKGSFGNYLRQAINIEPCQAQMLSGKPVDRVLRFEKLAQEVAALPFVPEGAKLPHINSSGSYDFREYYDEELAKLVCEHAGRDFDDFGYDRDSWRQRQ